MKKLVAVAISLLLFSIPSYSNEIVVEKGESIQDAIDRAREGDIIFIDEGIYRENIIINKSISLVGRGNVTIDGCGKTAMKINANGVNIINIRFTNSSSEIIWMDGVNIISDCEIYHGKYGIVASNAVIRNITIYGCGGGMYATENCIMERNIIYKCGLGIELHGNNNLVKESEIHTCGVGVYVENSASNIIEGNDIYRNNNNEGCIFLLNSSNNVIEGNNISYGAFGIRMVGSDENAVVKNKIFRSRYGIKMERCDKGEIKENTLHGTRFGVTLENCRDIEIHYNDICGYMYSMDARYSTADASHNWWGDIVPRKMHIVLSRIKYYPWLIHPLYTHDENIGIEKKRENETKRFSIPPMKKIIAEADDFDPLVDIKVGVKIIRARSIEKKEGLLKVFIEGKGKEYVIGGDTSPNYIIWEDVNDSRQNVDIEFIMGKERRRIIYDLATGSWYGDDWRGDENGYGHVVFSDAELWFDVIYNDYDGDGLTYWEEINIYGTSPEINDDGKDYDNDDISIEWEDKWGYNPFKPENHSMLDIDEDGLNNIEEYRMAKWLADPFRKDVFIEVDYMQGYRIFDESIQMLYDAFSRHNIMLRIFVDDEIPYKERIYYREARDFYWKYFLEENVSSWKHGIMRYVLLVAYGSSKRGGHVFVGWDNCDAILLACQYINDWRVGEARKVAYASLFMHEFGHMLGLFDDDFGGIDNESCNVPWKRGYWIYRNYKSCMNYRYAFQLVDYSDGSHGRNDFDDWSNIDLTFFKNSSYYS